MKWVEIPKEHLIEDGQIRLARVRGHSMNLLYRADKWIAFSSKCPHAGAPLSQGWCEDHFVICPYHRHKFDLETGKGAEGQGNFITIYPTKMESGIWFVALQESWWSKLF